MAWESDPEDFSPAATIVTFDPPLPLLRGPVKAGPGDGPFAGSFVLAFKDAASWRSAFRVTESKIVEQCEAGARVGCSISVSNKCKIPWWKIIFGTKPTDFAEREQCEEREMSSCMALAKDACLNFAKEKCKPAFQEARIATESTSEVAAEEEGSSIYKEICFTEVYTSFEEKILYMEFGCSFVSGRQSNSDMWRSLKYRF